MSTSVAQITPFLHVPDLPSTLAFFCETLPFVVTFRLSNYAYIEFDGHGLRVMEEPTRKLMTDGKSRVTVYIDVRDIDALHATLASSLAKLPADRVEPLMNKHYGRREFQLRMPDGDWLTFSGPIPLAEQDDTTGHVIERFNDAFNRHDVDALSSLLTDDTVFEDTSPAPDGRRITGKAAVVAFWSAWFAQNADAHFDAEDVIITDDRAVVRWIYRKQRNGQPWHLRGVDVFRVRDGKVAEKLAYVKG